MALTQKKEIALGSGQYRER